MEVCIVTHAGSDGEGYRTVLAVRSAHGGGDPTTLVSHSSGTKDLGCGSDGVGYLCQRSVSDHSHAGNSFAPTSSTEARTWIQIIGHLRKAKETSQAQAIPGREAEMSRNAAGGFAFDLDDWTRFHRFLVLGTEGRDVLHERTRSNARKC